MLFDKQSLFCEDLAIGNTGEDLVSTNYIDLGPIEGTVTRNPGVGNTVPLLAMATEAVNNLTSVEAKVQMDTVTNFASPTVVATSGAIAVASLIAGYIFPIVWLPEGITERYLRIIFTKVGGTNPTTGKITAGIVAARQTNW